MIWDRLALQLLTKKVSFTCYTNEDSNKRPCSEDTLLLNHHIFGASIRSLIELTLDQPTYIRWDFHALLLYHISPEYPWTDK